MRLWAASSDEITHCCNNLQNLCVISAMDTTATPILAAALLVKHSSGLMRLLMRFGIAGLFPISVVDSSFVPLPIPGITDLMLVLFAAQHENSILLVAIATAGSALGGWLSYRVGQRGGMAFIQKRTPKRVFDTVCRWMESHAMLAVALPAILPPPMPLSPFVLAAGALKMSEGKFLAAFTTSRLLRHVVAVALGIHYGRHILVLWNRFSDRYGTAILISVWAFIIVSLAVAFVQLWKTNASLRRRKASAPT
jgi:membrane protein YqaA with SNARE-associated domain